MNALFLTYAPLSSLGGVQRSVLNLAARLRSRGHEIWLASHAPDVLPPRTRATDAGPVLELCIDSPFEGGAARLRRRALDVVNLAALARLCRRRRIAVLHAHLINADTRYAVELGRRLGLPAVVTLRGGETEHWIGGRAVRERYVAEILRAAARLTAVSPALVEQALRIDPACEAKISVIPNFVDVEAVRATAERGRPLRNPPDYLLFSGRLEAMKDVGTLIDAYHLVLRDRPDFPADLVLLGDGSLERESKQRAASGPGASRIRFEGRVSYEDGLAWMRSARGLILPSASSEGCPNVLLEAAALGVPRIVSNLPANRWTAGGAAAAALVFPRGDAAALAASILRLANEPETAARLAAAALESVRRRHDPDEILSRYERLYEGLCP